MVVTGMNEKKGQECINAALMRLDQTIDSFKPEFTEQNFIDISCELCVTPGTLIQFPKPKYNVSVIGNDVETGEAVYLGEIDNNGYLNVNTEMVKSSSTTNIQYNSLTYGQVPKETAHICNEVKTIDSYTTTVCTTGTMKASGLYGVVCSVNTLVYEKNKGTKRVIVTDSYNNTYCYNFNCTGCCYNNNIVIGNSAVNLIMEYYLINSVTKCTYYTGDVYEGNTFERTTIIEDKTENVNANVTIQSTNPTFVTRTNYVGPNEPYYTGHFTGSCSGASFIVDSVWIPSGDINNTDLSKSYLNEFNRRVKEGAEFYRYICPSSSFKVTDTKTCITISRTDRTTASHKVNINVVYIKG